MDKRITMAAFASVVALMMAACGPSGAVQQTTQSDEEWRQPLFGGLGDLHLPITTSSELAQKYFDQGLSLAFAFNHAAADFAFNEAALHDPDCGMCYWGSALVLGPNVNAGMDPSTAPRAYQLANRARMLATINGSPLEKALTRALVERYEESAPEDRSHLDKAYAEAMRDVALRFPNDANVVTLTAEALMDLHPWDFWLSDGEERPWTDEIVDRIEHALALNPNHAGAIHLYIHAVEQSQEASRAEPYADKLADIAPAAGHLVHMPAHIYMRVGRYHDATLNNMKAVDADAAFVQACRSNSPIYLAGYIPHNWHFGWVSAAIEGWSEQAIAMAVGTGAGLTPELLRAPGMGVAQHFLMQPLFAQIRFGLWEDVLATAKPEADLTYAVGIWHYGQGRAQLATGDVDAARQSLAQVRAALGSDELAALMFFNEAGKGATLLGIAEKVLAGELQAASGELDGAISTLQEAVALEDSLPYSEPPDWYYPARHSLGVMQLESGDPSAAEQTYLEDLSIMPENGWALLGLEQALRAQDRTDEAEAVAARFAEAWQHADVEISQSRI